MDWKKNICKSHILKKVSPEYIKYSYNSRQKLKMSKLNKHLNKADI